MAIVVVVVVVGYPTPSEGWEHGGRPWSPRRREWIRQIRGERLQGIAEGASSAPRLVSSSAVSFPGRNECPGTHCSLIEQEEKKTVAARYATEFKIREKMEERTERESDSRRRKREMADLLVLPRPAKSVQNVAGFCGET